MHVDDIKLLAQSAHYDVEVCEALFRTMIMGEGKAASNAAWALTHLPRTDDYRLEPHRDDLVKLALNTTEVPIRRLSLALLERMDWGLDDVRTDLLDFCMEHMMMPGEPYGIKALCMKIAYLICRHYPELKEELRQSLLLLEPSELGTGVKHTRGKILEKL